MTIVPQNHSCSDRLQYIDILKGILIILVCIGHCDIPFHDNFVHTIIFWVHMPSFFITSVVISNFDKYSNKEFFLKRTKSLLVPYLFWCICLFLIFWFDSPLKYIVRVIIGGSYITTSYTYPFWFVHSLFLSLILYKIFKNNNIVIISVFLFFFIYGNSFYEFKMPLLPWSIETIPFVLFFFYSGKYIYNKFLSYSLIVQNIIGIISSIFIISISCFEFFGIVHIQLDMKHSFYPNAFFDSIVPLVFFLSLLWFSRLLEKLSIISNILSYIGKSSLLILFIHATILNLHFDNILSLLIIILSGCVLYYLSNKNKITKLLILGK